ncbi:MAG: co-chaperone GroES [Patescibacteria group bacterium]
MKIKPIGDRVLVKILEEKEEKTSFGIILPDSAQKKEKATGEILEIGEGEEIRKLNLQKGMLVLFKKWGGDEIELESGAEAKILSHEDIIAILEK